MIIWIINILIFLMGFFFFWLRDLENFSFILIRHQTYVKCLKLKPMHSAHCRTSEGPTSYQHLLSHGTSKFVKVATERLAVLLNGERLVKQHSLSILKYILGRTWPSHEWDSNPQPPDQEASASTTAVGHLQILKLYSFSLEIKYV